MEYDDFVATIKARQDKKYKFDADNNPIMKDTKEEIELSDRLVANYEATSESILICNP